MLSEGRNRIRAVGRIMTAVLAAGGCLWLGGCGRKSSPREKRVAVLFNQIKMHTSDERLAAIRELGQMKEPSAVQPLIAMLYEPRADVREAAVEALGRIGDGAATEHIVKLLDSPHEWPERKAAATALGELGDPAAIEPLMEALQDDKATVVYAASVALSRIGGPALPRVLDGFRSATNGVKDACSEVIGLVRDEGTVSDLRELLKDEAPAIRLAAARALCGMRAQPAVKDVVMLLDDKEKQVSAGVQQALSTWKYSAGSVGEGLVSGLQSRRGRLGAVAVLDSIGEPIMVQPLLMAMSSSDGSVAKEARKVLTKHAVEPAVSRLLQQAMQGRDPRLALGALLVAQSAGDSMRVGAVVEALKSDKGEVRAAAVDLLGAIGEQAVIDPLASALDDKNELTRVKAALHLVRAGDGRGRDAALESLRQAAERVRKGREPGSDERAVVDAATEVCTRLEEKAAAEPLMALLKHDDKAVVAKAVEGLGSLGDKQAAGKLVPLLKNKDKGIVRRAIRALGLIGDAGAVPALQPLLQDKDKKTVGQAVEALGRIGDPAALQPLLSLFESEDEDLRLRAITGLGHLGDPRAVTHLAKLAAPVRERARLEAKWRAEDERLKPQVEAYKEAMEKWKPKYEAWKKADREWQRQAKKAKKEGKEKELPPRPEQPPKPEAPKKSKRSKPPAFKVELAAIEALGNIGDPRAVGMIAPIFEGKLVGNFGANDRRTLAAMRALANIDDPRAFKGLVEGFYKLPNHRYFSGTRVAAMRTVAKADPEKAVPVLARALEESEAMDYKGLAGLLDVVGKIGDKRIFPVLVKYLRHDIASVREQARDAFAAVGRRNPDLVFDYLAEDDVKLGHRSYVSLIFVQMGPDVLPAMYEALAEHPSPQTRQAVAWGLGHMEATNAVPKLLDRLVNEKHSKARGGAVWALGQIGDQRSVQPLLPLLKDEDKEIRMAAAIALGQIGDTSAGEALVGALKDEDAKVRAAAALALGKVGDLGARDDLVEAQKDEDGDVSGMAGRAILMLDQLVRSGRQDPDQG